ncbi:MAG: IclR family transcriptional regulator [Burkholderiales bacterium]
MKSPQGTVVKSADRALDLLELLARRGTALSHTELASALNIPKSSLTQLVRNLAARRYLVFAPGPNTYAIGPAVQALVRRVREGVDLAALAEPLCVQITRDTGESSSLNLVRDGEIERVCGANSSHALNFAMTVGARAPLYAVSSGKAILAFLPAAELEAYLSKVKFERITPRTVASARRLRQELRRAAAERAAYSLEEFTPGIIGVAVPVLDGKSYPAGALNVAMPTVRYNDASRRRVIGALRAAARGMEAELGAR